MKLNTLILAAAALFAAPAFAHDDATLDAMAAPHGGQLRMSGAGHLELVLAKLVPYLLVGTIDLALCLLAARFLFRVPIRGSLSVIVLASLLYLTVSLLLGLFISGKTRNQFQASQVALLVSFMPALMLSGFIFDLRNVPVVVQAVSQLLPATHFVGLIKTLFLAGDNWPMILRDCAILSLYALVLTGAVRRTLRKTLD